MRNLCRLALLAALAALPVCAHAQGDLNKTIAAMNAASAKFQSYEANLEWDTWNATIRDIDTKQSGTFYCQRAGGGTQMGIHFNQPSPMVLTFKNGVADKWVPGQDQEDRFKIAGAEGYLALGCGGSGDALAKAWDIKDLGSENVTVDGKPVAAEKLDLTSKDATVRNNVTHILLWIDLTRDISVKQVLYQPSGDYKTSLYSKISYNKGVNSKGYSIPGNLKVISH